MAELWFGAAKSSRPRETRSSVDAFLRPFEILPFHKDAAEDYAKIRLALETAARSAKGTS